MLCCPISARAFSTVIRPTAPVSLPMKAGTVIPGLECLKTKKDSPDIVAKERSEYPPWMGDLAKPMISLAGLRRMPEEEANDKLKMRYLKLVRRAQIKEYNVEHIKG